MNSFDLIGSQKLIYNSEKLYGTDVSKIYGFFMIDNEKDIDKLAEAIKYIVDKLDSFHIKLKEEDDRVIQCFEKNIEFNVEKLFFETQEEFEKYFEQFSMGKLDIYSKLFELKTAKIGENRLVVLAMFHHIITDGWGTLFWVNCVLDRFYEQLEVSRIYSYQKYIEQNSDTKRVLRFNKAKEYWLSKYQNNGETDRLFEAKSNTLRVKRKDFNMESNLIHKILNFASLENVSQYCLIMASIASYISLYGRKKDFYLGTSILNRLNHKEKNTLGMFVNTLALDFHITSDNSFWEVINYTKKIIWESFKYQSFNYGDLMESIGANRKEAQSLFDIVFSYQNASLSSGYDNCKIIWKNPKKQINPLQIHITDYSNQGKMEFHFDYYEDIFSEQDIAFMYQHICTILEQGIDNKEISIGKFDMVTEKEMDFYKNTNRVTANPYEGKTGVTLFEDIVKRYHNHTAVIFQDEIVTYGELYYKAVNMAMTIKKYGIKQNDIIAVCAEKSVEFFIGILGILISGAAYLPIDPDYAVERKKYIIEDSSAKMVLVYQDKDEDAYDCPTLNIINETYNGEIQLDKINTAKDLAYIIYTSGTTGKPKGVMIEHRNLINLQIFIDLELKPVPEDIVLQFANIVFDASVWEIWTAFFSGAALLVVDKTTIMNTKSFYDLTNKYKVSIALLPPQYYLQVSKFAPRILVTGGSVSPKKILQTICKDTIYYNAYGPTENTVMSTVWKYDRELLEKSLPIGIALPNTGYFLMHEDRICGLEMPGELCVYGRNVARGYLNKAELTEEKFIESPFGRAYKTGDLVKISGEGQVIYLGRIDKQVKVRGYRVELGEIESAIRQCEFIEDVAVIGVDENNMDKSIFAYIQSVNQVDTYNIINQISRTLPEYMIPKYIVQVDKLPYTVNGKVDEKELRKVKINVRKKKYTPPVTEKEKIITECFEKILDCEKISLNDSFYEIGGDSIKAIRIVSLIKNLGYYIDAQDILTQVTIKIIIEKCTKTEFDKAADSHKEIGNIINTPIINQFFDWNFENPNYFNQCCMLKQKNFDEKKVEVVLHGIVKHHDVLRMILINDRQLKITEMEESYQNKLEIISVNECDSDCDILCHMKTCAIEIQKTFDLKTGNLVKAVLFKAKDCDYLLFCIHHICVDGFSWRIIIEDFINGYHQLSSRGASDIVFPAKTHSFIHWSEYIDHLKDNRAYDVDIDYWNRVCQEANENILPYDVSKEGIEPGWFVSEIDENCTGLLLNDANRYMRTRLLDLLLAGFAIAVYQITRRDTIGINVESFGRKVSDEGICLDRTVGWFTSIYPMTLSYKGSMEATVSAVKETFRYVNEREIGYGLVKNQLKDKMNDNILFNYLGDFAEMVTELSNKGCELYDCMDFPLSDKKNHTNIDIEINSWIKNGKLYYYVKYNKARYSSKLINDIFNSWNASLKEIADCFVQKINEVSTPSDYGYSLMNIEDFEKIKERYGEANIETIYPLTFLQEGMVYHKQLDEDSSSYIIQNVMRVSKNKDIGVIRKAFDYLTEKHSILRSSIVYKEVSEPVQVVLKNKKIRTIVERACQDKELKDTLIHLMDQDIVRGFDLEIDSLLRSYIIETESSYYILWSFHHVIMDGWCMSLLLKDFMKYCEAINRGHIIEVVKQNTFERYVKWLKKQNISKKLEYWEKLLEDYDEMAGILPINKKNKKSGNNKLVVSIDEEIRKRVIEVSHTHFVSVNAIFEAVLACVLFKYNNCNDVVFGKVVSGRNAKVANIEQAIGLFINTIPVRVRNDFDDTCLELMKKTNQQSIEGMEYHHCPLAEIQTRCFFGRELFNVLMVFENYGDIATNTKEYSIEYDYCKEETTYDLTISVYSQNQMSLEVLYDWSKYSKEEISLLIARIQNVLAQMVQRVNCKVNEVELITSDEKQSLLKQSERNVAEFPSNISIGRMFDKQVFKNLTKNAVVCEDSCISYAELKKRCEGLALELRRKGVGRNDFVAIIQERGIDLIVAIMAVIKAGAAYVPIDYRYPADRIDFILQDCKPKCILSNCDEITWTSNVKVNKIGKDYKSNEENIDFEDINADNDLAYMIYTSGTTGKPKGVMIEHHSLINMICAYKDLYDLQKDDVILQFASIAFDQSVWDIFSALLTQATLLMVPQRLIGDPDQLPVYADAHGVTVAALTPAFIRELNMESFQFIRILESGGAEANLDILKQWKKRTRIFNTYGPTETTVNAVTYEMKDDDIDIMPIGSSIPNTQVYILNSNQLCGIGVAGELCIAGEGLARGYYGRKELTDERFVKNHFGEGRLYRTGDLARLIDEKVIEYLGRIDEQVKIRGFRIELGEIENVLRSMNKVKDAVVITRQDSDNEKYLCAYVVLEGDIKTKEIIKNLQTELPNYMVPKKIMQIDSIPLTTNGKLDKKKLPEINNRFESEYIAPKDEFEQSIADAFTTVLQIEKAGINDNFFDNGGHSLKAIKLINEIEKRTKSRLKIADVFKKQTVGELAEILRNFKMPDLNTILDKAAKKEYYEMSSAQKRLYILSDLEDSVTYNMSAAIKIDGLLNVKHVKYAFEAIIKRHSILRTGFLVENDRMCQKIFEDVDVDIKSVNVNSMEEVKKYCEVFRRPFDFRKPPLLRIQILKLSDKEHVLLFDIHHIIADGITINLIISEFVKLYEGQKLKELKYSYVDYCEWASKRNLTKQKDYWLDLLKGELPVLDMPLDYIRPKLQSFKGYSISKYIEERIVRKVESFARENGVTEYMICMSAIMILLSKYSMQEDILIGTPVSGRTNCILEEMPGLFVNTVVLRGKPIANKSYMNFLNEVKENCYKALENQDYPFEDLVDEIVKTRDLSRNPIFDIMMSFQDGEDEKIQIDGLSFAELPQQYYVSRFDIVFEITKCKEYYQVKAEYCSDLYKMESMEYMLMHFANILDFVLSNPNIELKNIIATNEQERGKILHHYNCHEVLPEQEKTIMDYFEESVERNLDLVAVQDYNKQLTYREFNETVNKFAWFIRQKGIGPEDAVIIAAERTIDVVIAVFAVGKAGGMYVPVDASCPKERFDYIVMDSEAKLIITDDIEKFRTNQCETVSMDYAVYVDMPRSNPGRIHNNKHLMYMIYTSGTTGEPKGVEIENHSLTNIILDLQKRYPVKKGNAYLFKTSYTFDVSLNELFGWFFEGGRLVVLEKGGEKEPVIIADIIEKFGITHATFVPSMLNIFLNTVNEKTTDLSSMKYLMTLGEQINAETARMCYQIFPNVSFYNLYGPTEATIYATHYSISREENSATVYIGKPFANYQLYVVDENMKLCGVGIPGELCIAGDGLARGYRNKPELTADSFVENPFGQSKRIYKTGDRARWMMDGNLECLGRIDTQVKIRGFRIELGEIENVIRRTRLVKDVAVTIKKTCSGENDICVYFVNDTKVNKHELKSAIKKRLPYYMIPSYMMQIEEIPVNASGKLNKSLLPDIVMDKRENYVAPKNELEEKITDIFREVLKNENIGVTDNFFEMGGQSLNATKVINKIEQKEEVRIPLKDFFENPTVLELCRIVGSRGVNVKSFIPKAEKKDYYDLSSAQKRIYITCGFDEEGIMYNMPVVLEVKGILDIVKMNECLNMIIDRHEALRTHFDVIDDKTVQVIENKVEFNIEFMEDTEFNVSGISKFIKKFELTHAPLLRVVVIKKGDNSFHILFDMHHIISDKATIDIIIREFAALYAKAVLPELEIGYKDYSEWMKNKDLTKQKEYWMNQFKHSIPVLELPLDQTRPKVQSFDGAVLRNNVDSELIQKVKKIATENNATEYMVLLSVFSILLSKYSRQNDLVIGTLVSGRNNIDTENIAGMFVNTLALRVKPDANKNYLEYLQEVKKVCLKGFDNQEFPFEELVELVDVKRNLSRNPLFDVVFTLQDMEEAHINLPGVELAILQDASVTSKFDITLTVVKQKEGYTLEWEYSKRLFMEESISCMNEHFLVLLQDIVTHTERSLGELNCISKEEKEKVVASFNDTKESYPYTNIVELFEKQVEKTPDQIAVVYRNDHMTYKELNDKANQIAAKISRHVTENKFIAIMADKNIRSIIGILAILKAGCAYVPIDRKSPSERINLILKDCKPNIILYSEEISFDVQDSVMIDLFDKQYYVDEGYQQKRSIKPEDAAYVIYTSGTTGKPKGTVIEHRSVINLVHNTSYVELNVNTIIFQIGSLAFDASIFDLWGALLHGGRLCISDMNMLMDAEEFKKALDFYQINTALVTTALFNQMIACDKNMFNNTKYLLIGGEQASEEHVDMLRNNINIQFVNVYGPTENTAFSSYYIIENDRKYQRTPIGKPISNIQLYIMHDNKLCGIGMPGELCISGDSLSRGYLNKEELTAEKFITNPVNGSRMYKTGDLARWLPDGNIDYMGRMDEQVKIHGFRIELGEIESIVRQKINITDVVACVRNKENKSIELFIVADQTLNISKVKLELKNSLPEYMVPNYIMQIDSIPLNYNGKVDIHALPKVEYIREQEYVMPNTKIEQVVAKLYGEVLLLDKVSLYDDFFELGGNSINAISVINQINSSFNVTVSIRDIFTNRSVFAMAELIESKENDNIFVIEKAEEKLSYNVSAAQKRIYILEQLEGMNTGYNMPNKIKIEGNFDVNRFKDAVIKMVERHEAFRTEFVMEENGLRQRIRESVDIIIPITIDSESEVQKRFEDFIKPFDIGRAPLLRCEILSVDKLVHYVLIDMHHIISDGTSVGIVISDLLRFYKCEELKKLEIQYKDYSEWQNRIYEMEAFIKAKVYWHNIFNKDIPKLDLYTDYERPNVLDFAGGSICMDIQGSDKDIIDKFVLDSKSTLYMFLLSVYGIWLHKYSGQEQIVIGSPIAGRMDKKLDDVIGMFVNMIPIWMNINTKLSYQEYFEMVKKNCIDAYSNQIYQFDQLVEDLNIKRDAGRNPIFDVTLSMQNMKIPNIEIDHVKISYEDYMDQTKYDLMLFAKDNKNKIHLELDYRKSLFKEETIQFMLQSYADILKQVTTNPERVIEEFTAFGESAYTQMVEEERKSLDNDFEF